MNSFREHLDAHFPATRRGWDLCGVLIAFSCLACSVSVTTDCFAQAPGEPVVARVEMKLMEGEKLIDVIEKGDLLTVKMVRERDYVIVTHDGVTGAVAKVNAVQLAESTGIYSDLILANPDDGRFYTLRASAWWALGKTEKALADFDQAIENGYTQPHAYVSRGLFHAAVGNLEKALADYAVAIEKDPEDLSPRINRAAVYMTQGNFRKAEEDYTVAIKANPKASALLNQRAIARKSMGDLDGALDDFSKALELKPEYIPAVMGRGFIWFQKGEHEKAVEDFSEVIRLNPEASVAYNNRGYNLQQLGRESEALKDYDRSLELQPKYGLALQNKAWLLATSDDAAIRNAPLAIDLATRACRLTDYQNVSDVAALAAALAADGQFEKAVGWQEKAVGLSPEQFRRFAENTLLRYRKGQTWVPAPESASQKEQRDMEDQAKAKAAAINAREKERARERLRQQEEEEKRRAMEKVDRSDPTKRVGFSKEEIPKRNQ